MTVSSRVSLFKFGPLATPSGLFRGARLFVLSTSVVSQPQQWLTHPEYADRETEPLYLIQKPTNPKATSSSLSKPRALFLLLHRKPFTLQTPTLWNSFKGAHFALFSFFFFFCQKPTLSDRWVKSLFLLLSRRVKDLASARISDVGTVTPHAVAGYCIL